MNASVPASTARALVLEEPRRLVARDLPLPEIGAEDGLLRIPAPTGLNKVAITGSSWSGTGIRWGVTMPGTSPGDRVAVLGPGIRGLAVAAAVKDAGAGFVMVTGDGSRDAPRLETARDFGVDPDRRRRGRRPGRGVSGRHR